MHDFPYKNHEKSVKIPIKPWKIEDFPYENHEKSMKNAYGNMQKSMKNPWKMHENVCKIHVFLLFEGIFRVPKPIVPLKWSNTPKPPKNHVKNTPKRVEIQLKSSMKSRVWDDFAYVGHSKNAQKWSKTHEKGSKSAKIEYFEDLAMVKSQAGEPNPGSGHMPGAKNDQKWVKNIIFIGKLSKNRTFGIWNKVPNGRKPKIGQKSML